MGGRRGECGGIFMSIMKQEVWVMNADNRFGETDKGNMEFGDTPLFISAIA